MKKLLVTLLCTIIAAATFAQDLTVPNVSPKMRKFRGVESVQGLGYYCFVVDEKSKKGHKIFNLYIWDYDLKEIANPKLELEKRSVVIDAVFNGSHFLVVFYDAKKDNVRSVAFDKAGKKVADKTMDGIKTKFMAIEDMRPSYFAATDGFYGIIPDKVKKFGFTIIRYNNELKELWKNEYFPEKGMQVVLDAKSDTKKLVILSYTKGSKFSKKPDIEVDAFEANSGKKLWNFDLNLPSKVLSPTEMTINSKGNVAVGGMFFLGEKIGGINSDGIFFAHLDQNGKKIALKTQGWKGELQKFLKTSKNSITMGRPKLIFEDIIYDENKDEFKVIGELFVPGTVGKVLAMMGNDPDAETKITMEDLVVFTFGSDGSLNDYYSVDKARTNIWVPLSSAGGLKIASALKETGSLPYKFSALDENKNPIAFYTTYVKKDENGNLVNQKIGAKVIGAAKIGIGMLNLSTSNAENADVKYLPITKRADNIDKSEVEFDSKRSIIKYTESKPGYILISELTRKTGDLKLFLQEIK